MTEPSALQLLEKLVQQAHYAQKSIEASVAGVRYTGVREVDFAGQRANMFAVSVTSNITGQQKDIMLARTPELAKFVTLLMNLSGDIVMTVLGALQDVGK